MKLQPLLEERSEYEPLYRRTFLAVQQALVEHDWSVKVVTKHQHDVESGELHPLGIVITDDKTGNEVKGNLHPHGLTLKRFAQGTEFSFERGHDGEPVLGDFARDFNEAYDDTVGRCTDLYTEDFQERLNDILDDENGQMSVVKPKGLKELEHYKSRWRTNYDEITDGVVNSQKLAEALAPEVDKGLTDVYQALLI